MRVYEGGGHENGFLPLLFHNTMTSIERTWGRTDEGKFEAIANLCLHIWKFQGADGSQDGEEEDAPRTKHVWGP